MLSLGYVAYEFLQPFLPRGTFDWKDVWATFLGMCFSALILWLIWRNPPGNGLPE